MAKLNNEEARKEYNEMLNELREKGEAALREICSNPDRLLEYEKFKENFRQYGPINSALIFMNDPKATFCKTLKWYNEQGYRVRKNEHGTEILNTSKDNKTHKLRTRLDYVFDIRQTNIPKEKYAEFIAKNADEVFEEAPLLDVLMTKKKEVEKWYDKTVQPKTLEAENNSTSSSSFSIKDALAEMNAKIKDSKQNISEALGNVANQMIREQGDITSAHPFVIAYMVFEITKLLCNKVIDSCLMARDILNRLNIKTPQIIDDTIKSEAQALLSTKENAPQLLGDSIKSTTQKSKKLMGEVSKILYLENLNRQIPQHTNNNHNTHDFPDEMER